MKQLVSLLSVWSLCCCFQENLVGSLIPKCALGQMTVQWLNGTFKECLNCAECHPEHGLYPHKCGDTVTFPPQIECKKCESGKTFSDAYDSSRCKLCHSCAEHEVVTKTCTLTSDTRCSKTCNSDYFFSSSQQVCKKCSYCCLDGKDEEQPQCINKGLKAINQYCSPRPDRTCTPTETPTKSSSHGKIGWILLYVAIGLLFGAILYYLWRKHMKKKRQNVPNESNVENGYDLTVACDQSEALITHDNQGGLIQQETSTSQEVQQNAGLIIASAASTPQRSRKGIPHTGGFEESLPSVNVLPKNFTRQTDRTEEKKADESARVAIPPEKKDAEDDVSDNIDTEGAQGGHERKGSFSDRHNYLNTSRNYESLSEEDPDQHVEADESAKVAMPAENKEDESARVTMFAENKVGEDDVSDNIDGEGAQSGRERKGSFSGRLQSLCRKLSNTSTDYEPLSRKDPDQPIEDESARVTMPAENKDGKDDVSDNIVGKGAQGGRERKGSFSGRLQSLCRKLSNTSIDYEPLSRKDPDQPVEADESAKVAMLAENKDGEDDVSDNIDGEGAHGGREGKGSFSDDFQSLPHNYSNTSSNYESSSREDPDQPGEVSAAVHQRTRPRSNSLLRTPSIRAIKEENSDQPSGQSWLPKEVTIKRSPDSPEIQAGSRVEFRCEVNGCQQVLYRWFQDEQELPGGNNSTLILYPLKMQDFGSYRCEVRSDKRDDVSCVKSDVVELDVTPAEGKSYKTLTEVLQSSLYLRNKVENLLQKKVERIAGYTHVASRYEMDIGVLEQCENPCKDVIATLEARHPNLAVYHFCKVLKDKRIRRLDIVNELKGYLI